MVEISIFADESGEAGTESKYYLLTLVLHEQDKPIANQVELYEQSLTNRCLQNIPLHASPLLNGKDDYKDLEVGTESNSFPLSSQCCNISPSAIRRSRIRRASFIPMMRSQL